MVFYKQVNCNEFCNSFTDVLIIVRNVQLLPPTVANLLKGKFWYILSWNIYVDSILEVLDTVCCMDAYSLSGPTGYQTYAPVLLRNRGGGHSLVDAVSQVHIYLSEIEICPNKLGIDL